MTQQRYARLNQRSIADVYRSHSIFVYADLDAAADQFLERYLCAEYFGFNGSAWLIWLGSLCRGDIHQPLPEMTQTQEEWWHGDLGESDA